MIMVMGVMMSTVIKVDQYDITTTVNNNSSTYKNILFIFKAMTYLILTHINRN